MNSNDKINKNIEVFRKSSKPRELVVKCAKDYLISLNEACTINLIYSNYLHSNLLFIDFVENNFDLSLGSEILYYYDNAVPSFIVLKYYDFGNVDVIMFAFNGYSNKIRLSTYESFSWQKMKKELLFKIFPECVFFVNQIDVESLI